MHEKSPTLLAHSPELAEAYTETEQKFACAPEYAASLDCYKDSAEIELIHQVYLSYPGEPFSLRLREKITSSGEISYSATLKTAGVETDNGINRGEIETEISTELFEYYSQDDLPSIHKMRASLSPALTIDWVEGMSDTPLIEIEDRDTHPEDEWFFARHTHQLSAVTSPMRSMEELAHSLSEQTHSAPRTPSSAEIIARIDIARMERDRPLIVAITGRSGSGKSTILREVTEHYEGNVTTATLSTDDYHRGKTWLEAHNDGKPWENWELPIVYDTAGLSQDISRLMNGETIPRHTIDFGPCERVIDGEITPADIVFVEGLYAGCKEIAQHCDMTIDISTPLATCVGRRVLRDMRERPEFGDPETSLRYILETVEPAYRNQLTQKEI